MRINVLLHLASQNAWTFGVKNRIKVLRAERSWSQAELAERAGVSRNSINAVENGKFVPSLTLAFAIAFEFGLQVEDVFDSASYRSGCS